MPPSRSPRIIRITAWLPKEPAKPCLSCTSSKRLSACLYRSNARSNSRVDSKISPHNTDSGLILAYHSVHGTGLAVLSAAPTNQPDRQGFALTQPLRPRPDLASCCSPTLARGRSPPSVSAWPLATPLGFDEYRPGVPESQPTPPYCLFHAKAVLFLCPTPSR